MKITRSNSLLLAGLAGLTLILSACSSTSRKLNRIELGMNKADVIQRIGRPHSSTAQGEVEFLNYNLINKGSGEFREYSVKLVRGNVEAFGERAEFGNNRLAAPAPTAAKNP